MLLSAFRNLTYSSSLRHVLPTTEAGWWWRSSSQTGADTVLWLVLLQILLSTGSFFFICIVNIYSVVFVACLCYQCHVYLIGQSASAYLRRMQYTVGAHPWMPLGSLQCFPPLTLTAPLPYTSSPLSAFGLEFHDFLLDKFLAKVMGSISIQFLQRVPFQRKSWKTLPCGIAAEVNCLSAAHYSITVGRSDRTCHPRTRWYTFQPLYRPWAAQCITLQTARCQSDANGPIS